MVGMVDLTTPTSLDPGLTLDLHEYDGDDFWMSARRQRSDEDERWERRLATAGAKALGASGATFPDEDARIVF